jgi:lipopolysaccharide export LptBFGC system permease protein LptF
VLRTFYGGQEVSTPFDSLAFPEFRERPDDLAQGDVDENQMSYRSLGAYVRKLRESGRPTYIYSTERNLKLAYPFSVFLATLFAAPLRAAAAASRSGSGLIRDLPAPICPADRPGPRGRPPPLRRPGSEHVLRSPPSF